MRPISATTTIDAPRERVFELLTDMSIRPSFTDHFVSSFRLQRIEPVGVGASARFRLGDAGQWMDSAISDLDPPYRVLERGRGGPSNRIVTRTAWELVDSPGEATELTVTFWTEPTHPIDRLHEPWSARSLRRGWRRAAERLKGLAETGETPEHVGVGGGSRIPY